MRNSKMLGNKIATARKKANLSQADLAQQVSISPQAVGKWERGESMPDITTLNRIAEILGVDLNYFSESFQSVETELNSIQSTDKKSDDLPSTTNGKKAIWDMSKLSLADSDFSGLKNLREKFSSSNMQRCLFIGSDLSGLLLNNNNVDTCDFTDSDISNSKIQNSNLGKIKFINCSLKGTEFSKSNVNDCNFNGADLTKTTFKSCYLMKNTMQNAKMLGTSFIEIHITDLVFEGLVDDCRFENCYLYDIKFQNATLTNTFFKNNKKFKRVQFINCKVDKLTYAFLKNNQADLTGVTLLA